MLTGREESTTMIGACIVAVIGTLLPGAFGQMPGMNILDSMMNNPLAMSMLAGGGSGGSGSGMNMAQMAAIMGPSAAMMNPMAGMFEGSTMNDIGTMAMMDMIMNGNGASTGSRNSPTRPVNKVMAGGLTAMMGKKKLAAKNKKSKNGTALPKKTKGQNFGEMMQLMQLSRGGEMGGSLSMLNPTIPSHQMLELSKEGVGVNPVISKMLCPPQKCNFPLPCENPITQYRPETFFVCPKCPMCPHQVMANAMGMAGFGGMMGQQGMGMGGGGLSSLLGPA